MAGVALAVPHPGGDDATGLAPASGGEEEGEGGAGEASENEEEDEIIAIVAHERQPFFVGSNLSSSVARSSACSSSGPAPRSRARGTPGPRPGRGWMSDRNSFATQTSAEPRTGLQAVDQTSAFRKARFFRIRPRGQGNFLHCSRRLGRDRQQRKGIAYMAQGLLHSGRSARGSPNPRRI